MQVYLLYLIKGDPIPSLSVAGGYQVDLIQPSLFLQARILDGQGNAYLLLELIQGGQEVGDLAPVVLSLNTQ